MSEERGSFFLQYLSTLVQAFQKDGENTEAF